MGRLGRTPFRVRSSVRPWQGTFADVDRAARALAGALRDEGVGPGDVVAFQLPNWVEAGITFWAAAYLGAVVVPIVHFYGPKEVDYILRTVSPEVIVTADRFGHNDYLATYEELLDGQARGPLAGGRRMCPAADSLPAPGRLRLHARRPTPSSAPDRSIPTRRPSSASRRAPRAIRRGSSTPTGPSGARPASSTTCSPRVGHPSITGAPVGHFIGMLSAFLVPLLRERPVNLIDVWDPPRCSG